MIDHYLVSKTDTNQCYWTRVSKLNLEWHQTKYSPSSNDYSNFYNDCDVPYWKIARSQVILWRGGCVQLLQSCVGTCLCTKTKCTHILSSPKSDALYKPLSPKKLHLIETWSKHLLCSYTFHFQAQVMLQLKLQTSRVPFLLVTVISEVQSYYRCLHHLCRLFWAKL